MTDDGCGPRGLGQPQQPESWAGRRYGAPSNVRPVLMTFADALSRIPIGRVVAATTAAQATTWCYHPRHGHPCPLPCSICDDECGQRWRATCEQGEAEDLLRAAKAATNNPKE